MNYSINITLTLAGLLKGISVILGLCMLFYALLAFKYLYFILRKNYELLEKNADNLDLLIKDSSDVFHRVNSLTENIPESTANVVNDLKDSLSLFQALFSMFFGFLKKNKKEN